ncbi:polyubiquitin containing 7 ubiquitin monomer [Tanacetum coccineum]
MVSVKVEGSDTFDIVNAKVRAMEGIIPADSRNLQYIYNVNDDMDPTCRPAPWGMFKLFVHRLTTGETFTVFVSKDDTIMELKCKIWEEENSYFIPSCLLGI